jgi:tetratricopeptide (TPR) repeat protein
MAPGDHGQSATSHLADAETLLGSLATGEDLAILRRLQAMNAIRLHEYGKAEDLGHQALEFAVELPNQAGQAWLAIAMARAGAGDLHADEAFENAINLLHEHGSVRDYANLLRAYGRYLRDVDREREALEIFERAANVASNLQGDRSTAEREPR